MVTPNLTYEKKPMNAYANVKKGDLPFDLMAH